MQDTKRSFVKSSKITLDLVVSSTPELESCIQVHEWPISWDMESLLCGSDHHAGAMPPSVGLVCACFISRPPAKRCFLPPFDSSPLCVLYRVRLALYLLRTLSSHTLFKAEGIVFILFTTSQLPRYHVESVPILPYPLTAICDPRPQKHSFERHIQSYQNSKCVSQPLHWC